MATIFTQIVRGEIPCYRVAESKDFIAFLDIDPLRAGHTLVVPKIEENYIFDLDDYVLERMLPFAKRVARAIKSSVECERIGVAVIGLDVPHAHMHLVPISQEERLDFSAERAKLSEQEFKDLASRISAAFKKAE